VRFEWDDKKSRLNHKKHGVRFDEAKTVFCDPLTLTVFDSDHSDAECRFLDIGRSDQGRLLVVAYTERGRNVRLISARLALPSERKQYEEAG